MRRNWTFVGLCVINWRSSADKKQRGDKPSNRVLGFVIAWQLHFLYDFSLAEEFLENDYNKNFNYRVLLDGLFLLR